MITPADRIEQAVCAKYTTEELIAFCERHPNLDVNFINSSDCVLANFLQSKGETYYTILSSNIPPLWREAICHGQTSVPLYADVAANLRQALEEQS